MKTSFSSFRHCLTLLLLLGTAAAASAQGPGLDPAFQPTALYAPAAVSQAARQPDGKCLLLGEFVRVLGTDVPTGLARLLPGGTQADAVFLTNTAGLRGTPEGVTPLPGGQLLLCKTISSPALTLGPVSRTGLLRLLADGRPDPTFTAALPVLFELLKVLPQPDGKLLVVGRDFGAGTAPQGLLRRLNADGSLDTAFEAALGSAPDGGVSAVALLADGRIIVAGSFATVGGVARRGVARLLSTGAVDVTFAAAVPAGVFLADAVAQPDGRVIVHVGQGSAAVAGWRGVLRLLATGGPDASFQTGSNFSSNVFASSGTPTLFLQSDGRLLVSTDATSYGGSAIGRLVRLLPTGGLDASFANATAVAGTTQIPASVQLLPGGELLVATGSFPARLGSATLPPAGVARLQADGTRDVAFAPRPQRPGTVYALARQPDGKLLIGGEFEELNGVSVRYLARLDAIGNLDAAYSTAAAPDGRVLALTVQPDGLALVAGEFAHIGGVTRPAVARLTASGAADAFFAPAPATVPAGQGLRTNVLALQPDGKVVFNRRVPTTSTPEMLLRLESNGQPDASFSPALAVYNDLLAQPDGKLLGAGRAVLGGQPKWVWRLLPSGALDPTFTPLPVAPANGGSTIVLAYAPGGQIYVGGAVYAPASAVQRLLPNGTPDASFQPFALTNQNEQVCTLAVQPNGRLLVGGAFSVAAADQGSFRLLPDGTPDASYTPASGPAAYVLRLLVQPDGAIVAAGSFDTVAGLPVQGLTRLLDSNVLAVSASQASIGLEAWPIPAHDALHLRLDATARPQRVMLLDALGRAVRIQAVQQPELIIATAGLVPGIYLLQVQYASGTVSRRVAVK